MADDKSFHEDAKRRLARIGGQVAGLQKMVEEERYCVDILTQVSALRAALDQFGVLVLGQHIEGCVYGSGAEEANPMDYNTKDARMAEVRTTLNRFLK
jgi:DNA-binding FrmR family transcriptional regulator